MNQTEPASAHSYATAIVDPTWLQWYIRSRDLQARGLQSPRCGEAQGFFLALQPLEHQANGFVISD